MAQHPAILVANESKRRKGTVPLPPSDFKAAAPLLVAVGLAVSIVGGGDVMLFFWPPRFGDNEWEFGTIAQTVDALPLPTMGMLLLALAARAVGGSPLWSRGLAVAFLVALVGLLVLGGLFLLDVPVAFKA